MVVVLNRGAPCGPQHLFLFSPSPIFSPKYHPLRIVRRNKRYPFERLFKIPKSTLHNYPPFSYYGLPLPHSKRLRISAHLARPSNRRNSLREKLTEQLQNPTRQLSEVNPAPLNVNDGTIRDDDLNFDKDNNVEEDNEVSKVTSSADVLKSKPLGESVLWNKLEGWADQYKADSEFWGIGFNPIFTVFQNQDGKIERVVVNEDEILKRNGIEPLAYRQNELFDDDVIEVNSKISRATFLAREMKSGNYDIPKNSSLAKVVVLGKRTGFLDSIRAFNVQARLPMDNLPRIGIMVLCSFFAIWAIRALFTGGDDKHEYSRLEKEMLRRKMQVRKEREKSVKSYVEVIHNPLMSNLGSGDRPRLDKEELVTSIAKAKPPSDKPVSPNNQAKKLNDFDEKIMEIREMARRARETERKDSPEDSDGRDNLAVNDMSDRVKVVEDKQKRSVDLTNDFLNLYLGEERDFDGFQMPFFPNYLKNNDEASNEECVTNNSDKQASDLSKMEASDDNENTTEDVFNQEKGDEQDSNEVIRKVCPANLSGTTEVKDLSDTSKGEEIETKRSFERKSKVISSVKEAKEFLSRKSDKQERVEEPQGKIMAEDGFNLHNQGENESNSSKVQNLGKGNGMHHTSISDECNADMKTITSADNGKWLENNFEIMEPVIKKIGNGFRENYAVAREKIKQEGITSSLKYPKFDEDDGELDWMKDDKLSDIVFQVRDNELAGRDPFYLMDKEDKDMFFEGLEKKVEKTNEKLSNLHEWLHSNIENLDYGADGLSVYDPPEKIIPRWKGPPVNQNQNLEFLNNFIEQRNALLNKNVSSSERNSKDGLNSPQKFGESLPNEEISPTSSVKDQNSKSPRTIIEGSDGSIRAGKKSGKEFWEHTKKWSRGFLESYNAEADPEIKSVMKDMGKDLERWITEKEIQEGAELMDKLSEGDKEFIEKKLNKIRREMELFGPQAVASKYTEYGDQKEEDYLWWMDLPFILCIELYMNENGEQRVGLYSLEMAEDLELDPKQHHVIAFEDPGDCKNLCYIIQAHMEMLGNGNAFVIARPPKDAFREAKANGFSVTVIRKGELQLNVDQTLEEVEEQITEIGSKIYHEKIMRERSVDVDAIMKGVLYTGKPSKRRSRRRLKRPPNKVKGFG